MSSSSSTNSSKVRDEVGVARVRSRLPEETSQEHAVKRWKRHGSWKNMTIQARITLNWKGKRDQLKQDMECLDNMSREKPECSLVCKKTPGQDVFAPQDQVCTRRCVRVSWQVTRLGSLKFLPRWPSIPSYEKAICAAEFLESSVWEGDDGKPR